MASYSLPFAMSKAEPPQIGITEFIGYVRREIQKAHEEARRDAQNEPMRPFFELDNVELEIKFVTEKKGKAGIRLFVASLGGSYSREQTHTAKLSLSAYTPVAKGEVALGGKTSPTTYKEKVILQGPGSGPTGKTKP